MLAIIFILILISNFLIINLLLLLINKDRIKIENRLMGIRSKIVIKDELSQPLFERLVKPSLSKSFDFIARITPKTIRQKLDEKVCKAGYPLKLKVHHWIFIKIVLPVIQIFITFNAVKAYNVGYFNGVIIIIISFIAFFLLPDIYLDSRVKRRRNDMNKLLPEVIDLLAVSVEAGLSFDGAIARVIEKMKGELVKELNVLLRDVRIGVPRREALRDLSERCGIDDLTTFISSIVQADELGVGIGNVLRIQSSQIKEKRKQRVQEKAMKAPVKIMFPLVLFIFPTIFTILLGPALIRIFITFE